MLMLLWVGTSMGLHDRMRFLHGKLLLRDTSVCAYHVIKSRLKMVTRLDMHFPEL